MDFDALLVKVTAELKKIGVPVSDRVLPGVRVNTRAKKRYGCCRKTPDGFEIELSAFLQNAEEPVVCTVLAHELLHTCPGCMNHGTLWKSLAKKIGETLRYPVTRTADLPLLPEPEPPKANFVLVCTRCGARITRQRRSKLVQHPARYRCRCGGRLRRVL